MWNSGIFPKRKFSQADQNRHEALYVVGNEKQLRDAVSRAKTGRVIFISGDITITEPIVIKQNLTGGTPAPPGDQIIIKGGRLVSAIETGDNVCFKIAGVGRSFADMSIEGFDTAFLDIDNTAWLRIDNVISDAATFLGGERSTYPLMIGAQVTSCDNTLTAGGGFFARVNAEDSVFMGNRLNSQIYFIDPSKVAVVGNMMGGNDIIFDGATDDDNVVVANVQTGGFVPAAGTTNQVGLNS